MRTTFAELIATRDRARERAALAFKSDFHFDFERPSQDHDVLMHALCDLAKAMIVRERVDEYVNAAQALVTFIRKSPISVFGDLFGNN